MQTHRLALALALLAAPALAQTTTTTYTLHKFAKAIGKETVTLTPSPTGFTLTSDFLFTDRGSKVPLKATYTAASDLTPLTLHLEGQSSRSSALKDDLSLSATSVTATRNGKSETLPAPANTFLIDGYSPVAMQQQLIRFWLARNKPAQIPTPQSYVHIEPANDLTIAINNQPVKLHGYVVSGLIWGVESLWLDDKQSLAALVSTDAEFDHFEAVREDLESALPNFIAAAVKDDLAALTRLSATSKNSAAKDLVLWNATVIDATGGPALPATSVFIHNGVIIRVAPATRFSPRDKSMKGVQIIDATGKFIIPGLWDMHAHYEQVEWGPIYLAAGVTTVRDCGNEFDFITTTRDAIRNGTGIGPQILIAGIIDGPGPQALGAVLAATPAEAITLVQKYKAAGALQIKIYSSVKPEVVAAITAEAHRLGMTVTGHVPRGMTTSTAIEAGMDQINHIQYPVRDLLKTALVPPHPSIDFTTPDAQKQLALFKQHNTVFDPTMALFEWEFHLADHPVASFEPGITHVAPQLTEALNTTGIPIANAVNVNFQWKAFMETLTALHKAGLTIVAGTDQAIPGYSLHRELEIYVQAGFTPMEALQAATSVPARVMGIAQTVGTIEVGKRADLLILNADPLANIANTRNIAKTIANGAVYDPAPLWQSVQFKP